MLSMYYRCFPSYIPYFLMDDVCYPAVAVLSYEKAGSSPVRVNVYRDLKNGQLLITPRSNITPNVETGEETAKNESLVVWLPLHIREVGVLTVDDLEYYLGGGE